jgi:hypothetical protein
MKLIFVKGEATTSDDLSSFLANYFIVIIGYSASVLSACQNTFSADPNTK